MSIQHFATFWAHSQSQGSARLVGVALAQHANASTDLAWPSISTLMVETRLSERAVREGLAELLALGDFVEAGRVRSSRAFRLEVQCPAECDGTPAHARTEARDLAAARRASERDRKRAQRAARRGADEDPAEVVEATLEELSRQNLPGQEDARSTRRRIVPAESAGMSRWADPVL
ncbi:helix-turn-helix domain-containing protein [Brachybacterium huguangmaarense]